MAALDNFTVPTVGGDLHGDVIKAAIARQAWAWFNSNQDLSIPVRVWIIRSSVKLSQIRFVFEILFGPEPVNG